MILNLILLFIGFLFVTLFVTLYYASKKHLLVRSIVIIVFSYLQSTIIIYILYAVNFITDFYSVFTGTVLFAFIYHLAFQKLDAFISIIKSKFIKDNEFSNESIIQKLGEIWDLKAEEMKLKKYSDKKTPNAFIAGNKKSFNIFLGEELLKKLNNEQIIFTISHEIAHTKSGKKEILPIMFCLISYFLTCYVFANLLPYLKIANLYSSIIATILLMIAGIIIFNWISWKNELNTDKIAVAHTKDTKSAISTFEKFSKSSYDPDYGLFNLVLSDHPPNSVRIEKLQNIEDS